MSPSTQTYAQALLGFAVLPKDVFEGYVLQVPKTDFHSNRIINAFLRSGAPLYVGLFVSPPTKTGGGIEVTGGGYTRVPVVFGVPTGGITSNTADVVFPDTNDAWGEVGHAGIFDSMVAGNLVYFTPLAEVRQIQAGERFVISAGDLTLVEF